MALTLRLLGGLETAEIARAFLVPEATVAQRIVRAKKALHGQAFELPQAEERAARLGAVLKSKAAGRGHFDHVGCGSARASRSAKLAALKLSPRMMVLVS